MSDQPQFVGKCPFCRGTGDLRCYTCYGTGRVNAAEYEVDFGHYRYRNIPCPKCNGRGKQMCGNCDGTGEVPSHTPPPPPLPDPLDTWAFNRLKRERDLAAARDSKGDMGRKLTDINGRSIPDISTGTPSSLHSRAFDDDEREWLDSIRRGSRMRGDDPDDV